MNNFADYFDGSFKDNENKEWDYKEVVPSPYVSAVLGYLTLEWGIEGPLLSRQAVNNIINMASQIENCGADVPVQNAASTIMEHLWSQGMIRPDFGLDDLYSDEW